MARRLQASNFAADVVTQSPLIFMILASVLAVILVLKSPESSVPILSVLGRLPQLPEFNIHLDTLILRTQADFLQNFSTQIPTKGEWMPLEFSQRPVSMGMKVRLFFMVAAMDISVIIPTLNEEKYLPRCLKSLNSQTWKGPFEVIVVDGGSTDRTVQIAERFADEVLERPGLRVGAARNIGAVASEGEILAFVDADTIAGKYWLESIVRGFERNPTAVGLTGPTLPYDGDLDDLMTYRLWTVYLQRVLLGLGMPHVIGFNCAYRKSPFLSVGGFDENNVMSEDIRLAHKIRKYGKIGFEKQMSALTSARRFRKYGHVYLTGLYLFNGFSALLLNRSYSNYPPVR